MLTGNKLLLCFKWADFVKAKDRICYRLHASQLRCLGEKFDVAYQSFVPK